MEGAHEFQARLKISPVPGLHETGLVSRLRGWVGGVYAGAVRQAGEVRRLDARAEPDPIAADAASAAIGTDAARATQRAILPAAVGVGTTPGAGVTGMITIAGLALVRPVAAKPVVAG